MVIRGERLIKLSYSWFFMKSILVERLIIYIYRYNDFFYELFKVI